MSQAELLALKVRVDGLIDRPNTTVRGMKEDDRLRPVFDAVTDLLRGLGHDAPPVTVLRQEMSEAAENLMGYLDRNCPEMTRTEVFKAVRVAVGIAAQKQRSIGIPIRPKTLAQILREPWNLFENAFPGYAEAGMLSIVIRGLS